jgi:hypothetical protein
MSHRTKDGARVICKPPGGRRANGIQKRSEPWATSLGYSMPEISNPGNLLSTGAAGGNRLGHESAHDNEAPYPERVPERFILSLCPPGGIVLDPFSGSGTTASVAIRNGRRAIGLDLRQSQCELGTRRVADQWLRHERPHVKDGAAPAVAPLPGQMELFRD